MKQPGQMSRTATLVEGAMMVAIAYMLSFVPLYQYPWGGDITCFSTLPIFMMSLRHGGKWGVGTAAVYSLAQMLQGLGNLVVLKTLWGMVLCALLDYLLAYTILGFAGPVAARFKRPAVGITAGIGLCGLARYVCSVLSGVILWSDYAWEGWPVWGYSAVYNAAWLLPDLAIALVAALLLSRVPALGLQRKTAA